MKFGYPKIPLAFLEKIQRFPTYGTPLGAMEIFWNSCVKHLKNVLA